MLIFLHKLYNFLATLLIPSKVALHCAPSFLAFLKFRGLWRLLESARLLHSGDSISNWKFFSDMPKGGWVKCSASPSLPAHAVNAQRLMCAVYPSPLLSSAPRKSIREPLRQQHSACFTFSDSNFQGGVNQFPPSVLFGLAITPDIAYSVPSSFEICCLKFSSMFILTKNLKTFQPL